MGCHPTAAKNGQQRSTILRMNSKAAIVQRYELHARSLESSKHNLFHPENDVSDRILHETTQRDHSSFDRLFEVRKKFFDRFGYSWVRDDCNYRLPMERGLHRYLLSTLVDVDPRHPHSSSFSTICLKLVP